MNNYIGYVSTKRNLTLHLRNAALELRSSSRICRIDKLQASALLDSLSVHTDGKVRVGEWTLDQTEIKCLWNTMLRGAKMLGIPTDVFSARRAGALAREWEKAQGIDRQSAMRVNGEDI